MSDNIDNKITFSADGTVAGVDDNVDFEKMYHAERAESARLEAVLAATRATAAPHDPNALKPAITADRVKALAGPTEFLRMTRDKKLEALGADPKSVTDAGLKKLFGRNADFQAAKDLSKTNPQRYALLRECALITNCYGA